MSSRFHKTREDFKCGKCGLIMEGDGFTNHCSACLWSKHVDVHPGDRAMVDKCGGFMKPERIEGATGAKGDISKYTIVHACESCGLERRNKVSERDNFETVLNIVEEATK